MAILVQLEEMRKRLGFSDMEDVNNAIEQALHTSTAVVAGTVRTLFGRVEIEDTFFIKHSHSFGTSASQIHLKLSQGFVDVGEPVAVVLAGSQALLTDADSYTDLIDPDNYVTWDYERGVVRINDYDVEDQYVRVSYTAGFTDDGGDPPYWDDARVPSWLRQAASVATTLLVNSNPVFGREPRSELELQMLQKHLQVLLMKHIRYVPMAWSPIHSSANEL